MIIQPKPILTLHKTLCRVLGLQLPNKKSETIQPSILALNVVPKADIEQLFTRCNSLAGLNIPVEAKITIPNPNHKIKLCTSCCSTDCACEKNTVKVKLFDTWVRDFWQALGVIIKIACESERTSLGSLNPKYNGALANEHYKGFEKPKTKREETDELICYTFTFLLEVGVDCLDGYWESKLLGFTQACCQYQYAAFDDLSGISQGQNIFLFGYTGTGELPTIQQGTETILDPTSITMTQLSNNSTIPVYVMNGNQLFIDAAADIPVGIYIWQLAGVDTQGNTFNIQIQSTFFGNNDYTFYWSIPDFSDIVQNTSANQTQEITTVTQDNTSDSIITNGILTQEDSTIFVLAESSYDSSELESSFLVSCG